ncbi:pilus assembly protein N-terminal domain-containing protein [Bradyrhizobium elkanii]|uniref:Flp pilus assembly secretin CpaC n=1 Tax=Bradyrhizobium elkanii TaxID=29448 RepID=A0A8I2C4D8_BRAEL|nr:pilus assembly protein N-terminal domain-containing protein [Bradyrhizobium elkanii]MBP1297470.1 Flp pilus assembly secretin CpaC [Bradyrhizobium elkanii]
MFFRILCLSVGVVLATGHFASAQDDRFKEIDISSEDTIKLQPGEVRVFQFEQPVKQILTPGENTVEITPQTDRTFSVRGGDPGETVATAIGTDGRVIRRVRITVGGHLVKIYGVGDNDHPFLPLVCDEFGCNPLPSKEPVPKSVTVRTPTRAGGFVEKTY